MVASRHSYSQAKRAALGDGIDLTADATAGLWEPIYLRSKYARPKVIYYDCPDEWAEVEIDDASLDINESLNASDEARSDYLVHYRTPHLNRVDRDEGVEFGWSRNIEPPARSEVILANVTGIFQSAMSEFGAYYNWSEIAQLKFLLSRKNLPGISSKDRQIRQEWIDALSSVWMAKLDVDTIHVLRRPRFANIDPNGELHDAHGPCLQFANGRHLWALHGIEMPAPFRARKDRDRLKVAELLTLEDQDLRDVMCAERGWAEIAETIGCVLIDDSRDPYWGKVVDLWIPGGTRRFLDAMCGTGRRVLVPIGEHISTVNDAQESLHGGTPFWMLRTAPRRT